MPVKNVPSFVLRLLFLLLLPLLALPPAQAGVGVSMFAIFEPQPSAGVTSATAHAVAASFLSEFRRLMDVNEVWGIETPALETVTSAAEHLAGTRSPRWPGQPTPQWIALLNTSGMITYGATGEVKPAAAPAGDLEVHYEIRDFILNERIAELSATGHDPAVLGRELAPKALAALQLYFAEITEVGKGKALINVGLEALSTGTLLTAYAHGHLGPHPPGYPAHGHREEDDHLYGSRVYKPYLGVVPTSATLHSHSRSRWRSMLRFYPPAFEHLPTTAMIAASGQTPVAQPPAPPGPNPYDISTKPTPEEMRLMEQAHANSGRPTGVLRVTGFVKPHRFFNSYYAVAEVVEGFAVPGGFVRVK